MNISKRLRHLAYLDVKDRQLGRTTAIAKAAKENGGIVIGHNFDFVKYIERTHKVPAKSIEMNLEGFHGPFFLDHHAVNTMFLKAADKIDSQVKIIEVLQETKQVYGDAIVQLKQELLALQQAHTALVLSLGKNIETNGV